MTDSYIYAAYDPAMREVKVGLSRNPPQRMAQLRRGGGEVHLLAYFPGELRLERNFHRRLRHHRINRHRFCRTEWYIECPEVMLVVNEMLLLALFTKDHPPLYQFKGTSLSKSVTYIKAAK